MRIRSDATKQYMRDARWVAIDWRNKTGWRIPDKHEKIIVRIWIFWPNARRRDADNAMKILLDSLTGVLYDDDRQVMPRVMDMRIDRENPRVEVELERVE